MSWSTWMIFLTLETDRMKLCQFMLSNPSSCLYVRGSCVVPVASLLDWLAFVWLGIVEPKGCYDENST